jgi:uncharacterized membrane protein YqgA involved in biofilm formation
MKGVEMSGIVSYLTSISIWGSIVNCFTVVFGSIIGLLLKRVMKKGAEGGALQRMPDALMKGMALCVLLIGVTGAIITRNIIIVILSMAIGTIIGELCNLDKYIGRLGAKIEKKTKGRFGEITQGFVSASLLFCVGSMTIMGSLNSGLMGDHTILYTKSLIDMVAAFVLASMLGFGVLFSAGFVLVFQGTITLLAVWVAPFFNEPTVTEMTAVGSLLIIGLSLNMLGITKLKIMNYMPAIFVPILLCLFV